MTTTILEQIATAKKEAVATAKKKRPLTQLQQMINPAISRRSLIKCLQNSSPSNINVIAEIKRASPSAGPLRPDLNASEWAAYYESGGAAAISVLTDQHYFNGSPEDLRAVKRISTLPVLRKDFIVSSYQIYESVVMGADAVLLIVRILSLSQLKDYLELSRSLGLDALVEIHTVNDLKTANHANARLIGINNRDLASFHTDTNRAVTLVDQLAPDQIPVAASGIQNRGHILAAINAGIYNFLIGETLVRSNDPTKQLQILKGE